MVCRFQPNKQTGCTKACINNNQERERDIIYIYIYVYTREFPKTALLFASCGPLSDNLPTQAKLCGTPRSRSFPSIGVSPLQGDAC
jgi:hypothetical protein